jgi:hypothetical protein
MQSVDPLLLKVRAGARGSRNHGGELLLTSVRCMARVRPALFERKESPGRVERGLGKTTPRPVSHKL